MEMVVVVSTNGLGHAYSCNGCRVTGVGRLNGPRTAFEYVGAADLPGLTGFDALPLSSVICTSASVLAVDFAAVCGREKGMASKS